MTTILTALWEGIKRSLASYPRHTTYGIPDVYKHTHWNQGQHDHEGHHPTKENQ